MSMPTILVIRATGGQGTALIRHLTEQNFKVHAYVKDLAEPRALTLQSLGAQLFKGTLADAEALAKAAKGCTGVFLSQMPNFQDPHAEAREATAVLEAAKNAGVTMVVHSTSLGLPRLETMDPANSAYHAIKGKADVEELVKNSGIHSWTIIRPGYFMSNFLPPLGTFMFPELCKERKLVSTYKPHTPLPLVDPYDIGAFAAAAFKAPLRFNGQTIILSSENECVAQIIQDLAAVSGKEIDGVYRTDEETAELAKTNLFVAGQLLTLDLHELSDVENTKTWGVKLHSFREFLEREKAKVDQMFG